jgi:hypothetical protein
MMSDSLTGNDKYILVYCMTPCSLGDINRHFYEELVK